MRNEPINERSEADLLVAARQCLQLFLRLRHRETVPKSSDDSHVTNSSVWSRFCYQRNPKIRLCRNAKIRARDSYNKVRRGIKRQRAADDAGIASEALTPQL